MTTPPPDRVLRVAVLSELPTPYRWPLFRRVGAVERLDLTVFFYSRTEADRDWGLEVGDERGVSVVFPPGRPFHVRGRRSLFFHWNPDLVARLRKGAFDVVVIPGWSMPSSLAAVWACWRSRTPYVIFSETNDLSPRSWWVRRLKRVVLRPIVGRAAAWLATGTMSARFLERHGAVPARTHRFANTPDVEALAAAVDAARPLRAATRRDLGLPAGAPVALFVGRLIGAKDVATLLEAHARLEASGSPLWTLIVGSGAEAESLHARAQDLRLRQLVFAGARKPPDLPALWAAVDLFVLPSIHEPWGVVVNEAMAAGLPVVLSDRVGAGPDLLVDGETGRGFRAGDPESLAAVFSELATAPDARARMGAAAARRVRDWGYGPSVAGFERAVRDAVEAET